MRKAQQPQRQLSLFLAPVFGHPIVDRELEVASYFGDLHDPWQKGAVENSNRRLRRYLAHSIDRADLTGPTLRQPAEQASSLRMASSGDELRLHLGSARYAITYPETAGR